MRLNSKIILISLYSSSEQDAVFLSEYSFKELLQPITLSGLRSLLYQLCQQQLVAVQQIGVHKRYYLTDQGRSLCRRQFQALLRKKDADGWVALLFVKAPQTDAHFHYLRNLCLAHHALCLCRGVYVFPTELPLQIQTACTTMYSGNLIVAKVSNFISGFDWQTINQSAGLWDVYSSYSSISTQCKRLLLSFETQKRLTASEMKILQKLMRDYVMTLESDTGLAPPNVPEGSQPLSILSRLQSILQL